MFSFVAYSEVWSLASGFLGRTNLTARYELSSHTWGTCQGNGFCEKSGHFSESFGYLVEPSRGLISYEDVVESTLCHGDRDCVPRSARRSPFISASFCASVWLFWRLFSVSVVCVGRAAVRARSSPFLCVCLSVFLSLLHSSSFAFIRRSFCRVIHHLLFGLSPLFTVALFFWLLPWLPSQRATVAPFFFAGWRRRAKKTKPKLNLFGHWKWKNSEKLGVTEFSHLLTLPIHRGTRKIT